MPDLTPVIVVGAGGGPLRAPAVDPGVEHHQSDRHDDRDDAQHGELHDERDHRDEEQPRRSQPT
jgi:hypothetical protein